MLPKLGDFDSVECAQALVAAMGMSGPCSKTQTGCDIPGVSFLGGD